MRDIIRKELENFSKFLDGFNLEEPLAIKYVDNYMANAVPVDTKKVSDGYHTFEELYEFRKAYNAALFNEWSRQKMYNVHKSIRHNDGEYCFDSSGEWFIVVAILPTGQISNHYKINDWDLFRCPAKDKALFPYDGHTGIDVINRLKNI